MLQLKKVAVAAALGSLALPAVAGAHERPSAASVSFHIRSADEALDMVSEFVANGDETAATIQFALNRRHTHAATREARRLSELVRKARQAARAMRLVGTQQDENAKVYAELVAEVTGDLQTGMAHAINTSLKAREQAVATLTALLERLPEQAQARIGRVIAALSGAGDDEVEDLAAALSSGALAEEARAAVTRALGYASAGINTGLERLRELVSQLPPQAQTHAQDAIDRIGQVVPMLEEVLSGLFPAADEGESDAGDEPAMPGYLPIPEGLPIPRWLPVPGGLSS